ncbi:MAG: M20/M25/M40 family metallo-hydrolase [Deltaproteobacteria bacterium]|nr:M20/M25/M40 family metallo-hydrolase [Deltaproteobacteria bacterium]
MNWDQIKQEAITHLQNLIRINTTNPPGNEIAAVRYLSEVLKKEAIPHQIFEPAPGRASLVARLKGNGSKRPLLLTSHLDVVPAEEKEWERPPFSGDLADGFVWGRGALDMKQMTAMELMVFLAAKREGLSLKRDLILAAVADEEAGCKWGSRWLVANKPELIDAEYALNEVGGFSLPIDDHVFYPIGVAEKGFCWFKVTARGEPGHGSLPHDQQAVVKIAGAASTLGTRPLSYHLHPVVKKFISFLASHQKFPRSLILRLLNRPLLAGFVLKKLFPDKKQARSFHAMLHNTAAPTMIEGGRKVNVIPSSAFLQVDGRIIPGQTVESFLDEIKKVLGDGSGHCPFEFEMMEQANPSETDFDNGFYRLLTQSLIKHDPQAIPVPYLIPGFTDAANYSRLGIKCYGFTPLKLPPNLRFSDLFHGHNERVPVEAFLFGLKVMEDVVREACA